MSGHEQSIFWIIGYPNSGKTHLAHLLKDELEDRFDSRTILLDGDAIRQVFPDEQKGYDLNSRKQNALRLGRMAKLIASQHVPVIVAANTMFKDIQDYHREHLPKYFEIYLRTDEETRRARDSEKGLYKRFDAGQVSNVMGLDIMGEEPTSPDLLLDNELNVEMSTLVQKIIEKLKAP